jgi:hypothetical protein
MIKIPISELKPNLWFPTSSYIDPYNILMKGKQFIGQDRINKLREWQIKFIYTDEKPILKKI